MISFYATSVAQRMLRERSLMPPKVKFSKEAIIGAALQLVREEGMASLTARALAEKLGATPRVIFGQFANMAELQSRRLLVLRKWSWWSIFVRPWKMRSLFDPSGLLISFSPQKNPNSSNCFPKS